VLWHGGKKCSADHGGAGIVIVSSYLAPSSPGAIDWSSELVSFSLARQPRAIKHKRCCAMSERFGKRVKVLER